MSAIAKVSDHDASRTDVPFKNSDPAKKRLKSPTTTVAAGDRDRSPSPPKRGKARRQASQEEATADFPARPIPKTRRRFWQEGDPMMPTSWAATTQPSQPAYKQSKQASRRHNTENPSTLPTEEEDPRVGYMIKQPEIRPISQEHPVREFLREYGEMQSWYESRLIEVDRAWRGAAPKFHNILADTIDRLEHKLPKKTLYDSRKSSHGAKGKKLFVDGSINGSSVSANVDSGASTNIISRGLAETLGLTPDFSSAGWVSLPTGEKVPTLGDITGMFNFFGDKTTYSLSCVVMEKTVHDLVLGSRFLRFTQTLTKYKSRIRTVFSNVMSLNLLGDQQGLLVGCCNGSPARFVPDTGSDIMVMSSTYAAKIRAKIDSDIRNRALVQFIDGSEVLTDGLVRDVEWRFSLDTDDQPVKYDFHIINNLPVDGIVSNAFLDDFDVFSAYEDQILEATDEQAGIYGITLIEKYRAEIRSLESQYLQDINSTQPFGPEMEDRELARRDEIEDRINKLPVALQAAELRKEQQRRARWEVLRSTHNDTGGGFNSVAPADLPLTDTPTGGTGTTQQSLTIRPVVTAYLQQRPTLETFGLEADPADGGRRRRRGFWGRLRSFDTRRGD